MCINYIEKKRRKLLLEFTPYIWFLSTFFASLQPCNYQVNKFVVHAIEFEVIAVMQIKHFVVSDRYFNTDWQFEMFKRGKGNRHERLFQCVPTTYEPRHEISNNVVCATSKGSDQPAHMCSLIRAFASGLNIL